MRIAPVDAKWCHTYILEPYLQGSDLLNDAWAGKDVEEKPLSLKERCICILQGVALMTPFVNAIIWIAWKTFGDPISLIDRFQQEEPVIVERPLPSPVFVQHGSTPSTVPIPAPLPAPTNPTEILLFKENGETLVQWEITKNGDKTDVKQTAPHFSVHSTYRSDWTLESYLYQIQTNRHEMRQEGRTMHIRIQETERQLPLEKNYPVIQDRVIGLRPFVTSSQKELSFYAIAFDAPPSALKTLLFIPNPPFAVPTTAKKCGTQNGLLKVEVKPQGLIASRVIKSEMWFDPQTGDLKKFVDTISFMKTKSGEFVQNNPSPESARP